MYYHLKISAGTNQTGPDYPQVACQTLALAHQITFSNFCVSTLTLLFDLGKRSRLTDVLSQAAISANGFLISEILKHLLGTLYIMNHRFYPAKVNTNAQTKTYYYLHLVDERLLQHINFAKSKFYRTEYGFREEDLSINSWEEYLETDKRIGDMSVIKSDFLCLTNSFDSRLDLFVLPKIDARVYISQKARDCLIAHKTSFRSCSKHKNICA